MLHLTLEPPFSVGTGRSAARLLDALRPLPGAAARGRGSHGARGGVSGAQSAAVWEKAPRRQG